MECFVRVKLEYMKKTHHVLHKKSVLYLIYNDVLLLCLTVMILD